MRPRPQPRSPQAAPPVPPAVKSAERVLDLLELLAGTGRAMTHAELARRTGIPKSSLTQLLRTLVQRGYVEQPAQAPQFQLGERTYALARRGAHSRDLVRLCQPWLERLVRTVDESAALAVLRDDMAERIASVETGRAVLYSVHVGVLAPLYASSPGKVLLAWMPPAEREAYLRRVTLRPRTEQTIRSVPVLRRQLQAVREEGVAWSLGEFTAGVTGIAVPVLDVHGRCLAAVGVALPSERLTDARRDGMVRALRQAAQGIADSVAESASR
ncbi:IclR family transcriptional regulator [Ramlibacter sp. AW1]|uniref:IclR family transcriptional regulator n=1 Tax=Ramlibacter aurantiacus TaxID=2801330 RepID=A0A936ZNI4_9BURK|nr:IclR family transcriptional regulator [Ramlibacter aurantiacus]MBL0420580.1 IclR family transcriptional regulator [Ramlibacter aurantiacus]